MIDVRGAGDHRVCQRQYFAARPRPASAATELDGVVDHRFQIEPIGQRRGQQQASVSDQIRIIE